MKTTCVLYSGLLFVVAAPALAQGVAVSIAAFTPLTSQVATAATTVTQVQPIGPLPAIGGNSASLPAAGTASTLWYGYATDSAASFRLDSIVETTGTPGAQGRTGPDEFLVTFQGLQPPAIPVRWSIAMTMYDASSGALPMAASIDLGNDGTFDWQASFVPLAGAIADLVVQPLVFRVRVDNAQLSGAHAMLRIEASVVPDRGISLFRIPAACGFPTYSYFAETPFQPSLADVGLINLGPWVTSFHVVGLSAQPQLLPMSSACLLLPNPDLVLRTGSLFLAIPAAVRPVNLFTQMVWLEPGPSLSLSVSDTWLVTAQ